jgi:hypothetical protein
MRLDMFLNGTRALITQSEALGSPLGEVQSDCPESLFKSVPAYVPKQALI